MFTEILKIIPRLDNKDLNSMERSLSSRFTKVAKRFGSGLVNAIKSGAVLGLAVGLIDKILNPLKEVQSAIEKTLETADKATTDAEQFNTTAGKLFRLQQFAAAKGLDAETLSTMINKFQIAVAEAQADPSKQTAVRNFVGIEDSAEGFFEFIQSLQKLKKIDPNAAVRAQAEVFGAKLILKQSEFANANFELLQAQIGGPSAEQLTNDLKKLDQLGDDQNARRAQIASADISRKAALIQPSTMGRIDEKELLDLKQENKNLESFDNIAKISIENQKLANLAIKAFLQIAPVLVKVLPKLVTFGEAVTMDLNDVKKVRAFKGYGNKDGVD